MGNWEVCNRYYGEWFVMDRCITKRSAIRHAKNYAEVPLADAIIVKHRRTGREALAWHREAT